VFGLLWRPSLGLYYSRTCIYCSRRTFPQCVHHSIEEIKGKEESKNNFKFWNQTIMSWFFGGVIQSTKIGSWPSMGRSELNSWRCFMVGSNNEIWTVTKYRERHWFIMGTWLYWRLFKEVPTKGCASSNLECCWEILLPCQMLNFNFFKHRF